MSLLSYISCVSVECTLKHCDVAHQGLDVYTNAASALWRRRNKPSIFYVLIHIAKSIAIDIHNLRRSQGLLDDALVDVRLLPPCTQTFANWFQARLPRRQIRAVRMSVARVHPRTCAAVTHLLLPSMCSCARSRQSRQEVASTSKILSMYSESAACSCTCILVASKISSVFW